MKILRSLNSLRNVNRANYDLLTESTNVLIDAIKRMLRKQR